MRHFNYEPDVTGPFEGERLGLHLGFAKPDKYQVKREEWGPYSLHLFQFPRERYIAAQRSDDVVVEIPLGDVELELLSSGSSFTLSTLLQNTYFPARQEEPEPNTWRCERHGRDLFEEESCDACTHDDDDCDPLYCQEGLHTCPDCDLEIDTENGPYNTVAEHMRVSCEGASDPDD